MLGLLTRKLRTHSLNERTVTTGDDSEDDSSTGGGFVPPAAPYPVMNTRPDTISPSEITGSISSGSASTADSPYFMMTGTDLHYDQHSSEEELEVINSAPKETFRKYSAVGATRSARGACRTRPTSTAPPEKRKWAQTQGDSVDGGVGDEAACGDRLASPFTAALSVAENDENAAANAGGRDVAQASSDEEALRSPDALPAPVRFRTSPPLEAVKPRRGHRGLPPLAALSSRPCACCAAARDAHANSQHLFHYEVSPRKRSRHSARRHIQRPCLDFDKMQQLKVRAVTAWRHGGAEHGGELSVFCW